MILKAASAPLIINSTSRHAQSGFSLIELALVILIIVLISMGIGLVSGNRSLDQLNTHGNQLFARMNHASDSAIFSGNPIGLAVSISEDESESQYRWFGYQQQQWLVLDKPLQPVTLPKDIQINVTVDGETADLIAESLEAQPEQVESLDRTEIIDAQAAFEGQLPQVVFDASGEISDATLTLTPRGDKTLSPYIITLNDDGELTQTEAREQ